MQREQIPVIEIHRDRSDVCAEILDDLPEWFGIPESKADYIAQSAKYAMWGCFDAQEPIGFISLKPQTAFAVEIFVFGVKRRFHRNGIGRALVEAAALFAAQEGYRLLTVKTLAASHPDPHYAATRKFYETVGFLPVEVFESLWGEGTPCLFMVRVI